MLLTAKVQVNRKRPLRAGCTGTGWILELFGVAKGKKTRAVMEKRQGSGAGMLVA
jgi:hypothetical protein